MEVSIESVYDRVKSLQPEEFLISSPELSSSSVGTLKHLYDFTKDEEIQSGRLQRITTSNISGKRKSKKRRVELSLTEAPLSKLLTDSFDSQQIWEEIQLQNGIMYENLVSTISKLLAQASSLHTQAGKEEGPLQDQTRHKRRAEHVAFEEDDEYDSSEIEFEGNRKKEKGRSNKRYSKSVVDDKFFNLAQMTEFLERVESQHDTEDRREDGEESGSDADDSVDMFEDIDDEKDNEENGSGANVFYDQFFDRPLDETNQTSAREPESLLEGEGGSDESSDNEMGLDSESEAADKADTEKDKPEREMKVGLDSVPEEASDSSEDEGIDDGPPGSDSQLKVSTSEKNLSTFEKRRKKIEENIEEMEKEAMQPKGWQYQGEVTAERRPENSLLEEHLLYDHLLRSAPEITAETTLLLEDVIKQRIKDQAWDDVERKAKPVETPFEYKNKLVLDSEKSKQSLAQLYEEEYIKKKQTEGGQNDEESVPEEEAQIQKEMRVLFAKLDALSNFHFTPKPPTSDVKIVTNLPSIAMEEVAPVSASDGTLLAPQEIQSPIKGEMKGTAERTSTDKKRERRLKKKKQHLKRIDREERAKIKSMGLRNVKLADNILSKKKSKRGNTDSDTTPTNSKELKSSKAFFDTLQSKVQSQIKDKISKSKKSEAKKNMQPKRFKL